MAPTCQLAFINTVNNIISGMMEIKITLHIDTQADGNNTLLSERRYVGSAAAPRYPSGIYIIQEDATGRRFIERCKNRLILQIRGE